MRSPLEYDNGVVKEFKITDDIEHDTKIGFVRIQLEQIRSALYRERTELIVSATQVELADDDIMRSQHQSKVSEHRLLIKQFTRTVGVYKVLLEELESTQVSE